MARNLIWLLQFVFDIWKDAWHAWGVSIAVNAMLAWNEESQLIGFRIAHSQFDSMAYDQQNTSNYTNMHAKADPHSQYPAELRALIQNYTQHL